MAEDKVIKSGQVTLPRLGFLIVSGLLIYFTVTSGKIDIGYLILTGIICVLLFLIAIDYKVKIDRVDPNALAQRQQAVAISDQAAEIQADSQARERVRRRSTRSSKRRR